VPGIERTVDIVTLIYALTVLASSVAAILAWVAKIRWAREFKEAKEAQIEALREQITKFEKLSPPVILEWMESVNSIAQKQTASLETQLKDKEENLQQYQRDVEQLMHRDQIRHERIQEAEKQRDEARAALDETKSLLAELLVVKQESENLGEMIRGRSSRLHLPSTKTWSIPEANQFYNEVWRVAHMRLVDLKSGDSLSETRVQQLEEFANNLASDEIYAREVFKNLKADSSYYDHLLKSSQPSHQKES
jgi:hypothetical protein